MKIKNLILLIPFFLMGCQVEKSRSVKVDLPVIDISKQYPKEEICLQDIADSEYIPLETTDDILLSAYRLVSKKDGSLISVLNIHLPKRYSTRMLKKVDNLEQEIYI